MATWFSSEHAEDPEMSGVGQERPVENNIAPAERVLSLAAGAGLALWGLRRRGLGGLALALAGGGLVTRGLTGRSYLYDFLGVNTVRPELGEDGSATDRGFELERSTVVNRSPEELYRFWNRLENLPQVMENLQSVRVGPGNRSCWVIRAPFGQLLEWDARIRTDIPNELIAWESFSPSGFEHEGSVRFQRAPGGGPTEVTMHVSYHPDQGSSGSPISTLFGNDPQEQVEGILSRFRDMMESGAARPRVEPGRDDLRF